MKILGKKRFVGLMLAPFALFTACVGLTPEEQAEYRELQKEVRRIQVEEIQPRQERLRDVVEGKLVVNIEQLQAQINHVRNERLGPLNEQLAALQSGQPLQAAPGTRIELEELNTRLSELERLYEGLQSQIAEHRGQLDAAKQAAAAELEASIEELELALSEAADEELAAAIEKEIVELREEIETRQAALIEQFEILIHGLEISLHDISEEKSDVIERLHDLELSAHEELGKTIDELEELIEEIISTELRPLIEQMNEATAGGDVNAINREQLKSEIEHWLEKLTSLRARLNELTSKSFQSLLSGLDLGSLLSASA